MPDPTDKKAANVLTRARVGLQLDYPFFGCLLLNLPCVETPDLDPPTMATDGRYLYYNPGFVKGCTMAQLQGVLVHEIDHIILDHMGRRQTRERKRWNTACDLAINPMVLKEGLHLPENALQDPQFYDMSAEKIYSNLPVNKDGECTVYVPMDSHDKWDDWDKDPGDGSPSLTEEWRQRTAMAAAQAKIQGKMPAGMEELIGELLQPKLDWKALLQDRITSCAKNDFKLFPPNKKHIYRGFILPSVSGEEINIAYILDSSGSVSNEEAREAMSELQGICEQYEEYTIYLFVADAKVQARYELHQFDPLPNVIVGRGGTNFCPAIEEAEKLDITAIVYHTDLEGIFPSKEPSKHVIWLATTDHEVPWGSVIRYPRNKY